MGRRNVKTADQDINDSLLDYIKAILCWAPDAFSNSWHHTFPHNVNNR